MKKATICKFENVTLLFMVLLLCTACPDDKPDYEPEEPTISVKFEGGVDIDTSGKGQNYYIFDDNGGELSLNINSTGLWSWKIEGEKWFAIKDKDGNELEEGGQYESGIVSIKPGQNLQLEARENTRVVFFSVNDNTKSVEVTVGQKAATPYLHVLSDSEIKFASDGGKTVEIYIKSNTKWTATTADDWVTLSENEGFGDATIAVTVAENKMSTLRETYITVKTEKDEEIIDVVQEASAILYQEPYTEWGASVADTKTYMKGYTLISDNAEMIAYDGMYSEIMTTYSFDEGKLYAAAVVIQASKTKLDNITKQLENNGYTYIGNEDNGTPVYWSGDSKTTVGVAEQTVSGVKVFYITYIGVSDTSSNILFENPFLGWGATVTEVKNTMESRGYKLSAESSNSDNGYYLGYEGKHKELLSMYNFDSNAKLSNVFVAVRTSVVSKSEVCSYLLNELNYSLIAEETEYSGYSSQDFRTIALVTSTTLSGLSVTLVTFVPLGSGISSVQSNRNYVRELMSKNNPAKNLKVVLKKYIGKKTSKIVQQTYKVMKHHGM